MDTETCFKNVSIIRKDCVAVLIIIIEMNYFCAMIVNPSGKHYDQHCGPNGVHGRVSD